jgi:hypothetical protein
MIMAGDWIKVEKATARKPEIMGIARELSISMDAAFGLCFRFWCWCDDNLTTGNTFCVTESLLDETFGKQNFASAMVKVGWLKFDGDQMTVPNFDRHLSKGAKSRAEAAIRVADCKRRKREERYPGNELVTKKALPEKRREDMNTDMGTTEKSPPSVKAQPKTEFPDDLDTPEFRATWAEWIQHRIEIKKPMKPLSAKKLLKSLAEGGERKAIESINQSIANGWQGVFEVKAGSVAKSSDMFSGIRSFMENTDEQGRFFTRSDNAGSGDEPEDPRRASVRVVQNLLESDGGAVGNSGR